MTIAHPFCSSAQAAIKEEKSAADASAELKDIAEAGFKSLLAGWEEVRKTFKAERK